MTERILIHIHVELFPNSGKFKNLEKKLSDNGLRNLTQYCDVVTEVRQYSVFRSDVSSTD